MTASIVMRDYRMLQNQTEEDFLIVSSVAKTFKDEYKDYFGDSEKDRSEDYKKMLSQTALSMKQFANSNFKDSTYLDLKDIDQIKAALENFATNDDRVRNFKTELLGDLNEFQKCVEKRYYDKIADYKKKKSMCERKALILEFEKNKLIMERLSKIAWPYDEKTKTYDAQIESLQTQAKQYAQKIYIAERQKPQASEKDILIYQMHMKEKFSKMAECA